MYYILSNAFRFFPNDIGSPASDALSSAKRIDGGEYHLTAKEVRAVTDYALTEAPRRCSL
jgi:hypothetical protein